MNFQRTKLYAMVALVILFLLPQNIALAQAQHQIYNVREVNDQITSHATIHIRTSLCINYVWVYNNGRATHGQVISQGATMQVWQVRFINSTRQIPVAIYANSLPIQTPSVQRYIYYWGCVQNVSITHLQPQTQHSPPITISHREEVHHHISTIVTVSNDATGQIVTNTATAMWRNIAISGDENFVRRTLNALIEVENGPEWAYNYVTNFLNYIVQYNYASASPRAGGKVNVRTRRFYVYTNTYTSNLRGWYASTFIHEAVHVRQFETHQATSSRTPFATSHEDRVRLEIEAVEIQARFLDDIGAITTADMARGIMQDIHRGIFWW